MGQLAIIPFVGTWSRHNTLSGLGHLDTIFKELSETEKEAVLEYIKAIANRPFDSSWVLISIY